MAFSAPAAGSARLKRCCAFNRAGVAVRPAVTGETLKARGPAPGPAFRQALDAAQVAAWDGQDPSGQLLAAERAILGSDAPGGSHL